MATNYMFPLLLQSFLRETFGLRGQKSAEILNRFQYYVPFIQECSFVVDKGNAGENEIIS